MTNVKIPNSLVSVQFLAENLSAENLIVLDASMKPVTPVANTGPAATRYIPNSLRFDFDNEIRDHNTSLPHMMPSPEFFSDEMQKMGINKNSAIVVYDNVGVYASPRAWWMFRAMGHDQIAVLDGGLPAWITAGYETVTQLKEKPEKRGDFISQPQDGMFVDSSIVLNALNDDNFSVMDARSEGRFKGLEPEPRESLRGGHMPNAINIPFSSVLENGMLKSKPGLQSIFEGYKNRKMIFSCGSGVTACILALAAEQAGYQNLSVYDGSWSEWGLASSKLPVTMD
ncbi:MAG: sulfurtransferase [Anaerolineales bacterium]|nr:sulfurtransferase [Anaerolineales bacterium]